METEKVLPKNKQNFYCDLCDYTCTNKSNFNKHLYTRKHLSESGGNTNHESDSKYNPSIKYLYKCDNCGRQYASKSGFWKHSQKCNTVVINKQHTTNERDTIDYKDMCLHMLKQNEELQQTIQDMIPHIGDKVTNQTFSNNKINMNIFLNEKCKNALNLMDFVKSLHVGITDLEHTRTNGFVEGISGIIIRGLQCLDVYQRPIHCSDIKRDVLYVKDNNAWQKEDESKTRITEAINEVKHNNFKQVATWKSDENIDSITHPDGYVQLVTNCIGGTGSEQDKNVGKVIKNVAKEVYVNLNDHVQRD